MKLTKILPFFSLLILLNLCRGADNPAAPIDRFVNEETLLVIRLDVDRVDMGAVRQWVNDVVGGAGLAAAPLGKLSDALNVGSSWIDALRKAGGHTVYLVATFTDRPGGAAFFAAPVTNGVNADALAKAMQMLALGPAKTAQIDQTIIYADESTLARLRNLKPSSRPELAQALADAGDVPLRIAFIPSEDVRRVVEAMSEQLPKEFGAPPTTVLTHGARWASAGIALPPQAALHLRIQSQDAEAANALANMFRTTLQLARKEGGGQAAVLIDTVAKNFLPTVEQDHLALTVDSDHLRLAARTLIGPMIAARRAASGQVSANNVRQLLLQCIVYANDRKDKSFPNSLEDVIKGTNDLPATLLVNPRNPSAKPGYVYIKPPSMSELKDGSNRVVIYETHALKDTAIVVGFADGHVEMVANDAELQKLLVKKGAGEK